jgi:hypothetical protein
MDNRVGASFISRATQTFGPARFVDGLDATELYEPSQRPDVNLLSRV